MGLLTCAFELFWSIIYDVGPTLVRHRVDMSCLPGEQVKLPGTQDMLALFWISAGPLSMTLTQRLPTWSEPVVFYRDSFSPRLRNSIYHACPANMISGISDDPESATSIAPVLVTTTCVNKISIYIFRIIR